MVLFLLLIIRYQTLILLSKKQIMMQKYQKWKKKYFSISDYNKFMNNMVDTKITEKSQ